VQKAGQVAVGIGMRMGQGIPHAGLRRQMYDAFDRLLPEQGLHSPPIGQIEAMEREA